MALKNGCRSCGRDFTSIENFDLHRIGVHSYTYGEGLKMPGHPEDGRRCMFEDELADAGMSLDASGRWTNQARNARAHAAFPKAA